MTTMRRAGLTVMLAAVMACGAAQANGNDHVGVSPEMDGQGWRVQLTPYGWLPTLSGELQPRTDLPTFSANLSASDLLRDLDGAFFLTGTARKERFVILGDLTWASISESRTTSIPQLPTPVSFNAEMRQTALTLATGYSVVQEPGFRLDVVGGARAWRIRASVSGEASTLGASGHATRKWIDPIVGVRALATFTSQWSLTGYADVGGFDVGSRSTWQLVGAANYRLSERFSLSAGYRHMTFDYRKSGQLFDVDMSGPLLGATIRF